LENAFDDNLKNAFDDTKIITDKDDMILSFSKKFAHYLTINDVTLSISRKGKEAITIGKEAKPTSGTKAYSLVWFCLPPLSQTKYPLLLQTISQGKKQR
jgi:hypothetical protein